MDAFTACNITQNKYRIFYNAIAKAAKEGEFKCCVALKNNENVKQYYSHLFNLGYAVTYETDESTLSTIVSISWNCPHSKTTYDNFTIDVPI